MLTSKCKGEASNNRACHALPSNMALTQVVPLAYRLLDMVVAAPAHMQAEIVGDGAMMQNTPGYTWESAYMRGQYSNKFLFHSIKGLTGALAA